MGICVIAGRWDVKGSSFRPVARWLGDTVFIWGGLQNTYR
jgi:hypothetical protein